MSFMSILSGVRKAVAFLAKIEPIAVEHFGLDGKPVTLAGAGLAVAGDIGQAVASKGAAADMAATGKAIVGLARDADVPQQVLSDVAAAGSTLATFAPVAAALVASEMPEHQALGNALTEAAGLMQSVSSGVAAGLTPPGNG